MDKQGYFYIIPVKLAESGPPSRALLFGLITSLSNREGHCWATNIYLAKRLGMKGIAQVSALIRDLESEGYLEIENAASKKRRIRPVYNLLKNQNQPSEKSEGNLLKNQTPNRVVKESNINKDTLKQNTTRFWGYFTLKTGRKCKLTPDRQRLIEKCLSDWSLRELMLCVDAFVVDEWPGRKEHLDLIYCIGHQRGKPDNVEKWLIKAKTSKVRYH